MSVCSEDILSLAIELLGIEGESRVRASVGRSYYALYHEALSAADALSLATCPADKRLATHERLIYRFENGGKGLAAMGRTIRKQKQMRAIADYDLDEELRTGEARLHIANSKRLINDLKRLSQPVAVG